MPGLRPFDQFFIEHFDESLPKGSRTFVKALGQAGYQTAIFGKWHVHAKPEGFDDYKILPGQGLYFDPYFITPDDKWPEEDGEGNEGERCYPEGTQSEG